MRYRFNEELKSLNDELLTMCSMVEKAIDRSVKALYDGDVETARKIMAQDDDIDKEQTVIQQMCFDLLMTQQPVASDLRFVSAASSMVRDMERIGDHAADIAEITILIQKTHYRENLRTIRKMADATTDMLRNSILAFIDRDEKMAKNVIKRDDVVDELFVEAKAEVIGRIRKDEEIGEEAADLLMVAKYFERIGDHAVNIAEDLIFAVENHR